MKISKNYARYRVEVNSPHCWIWPTLFLLMGTLIFRLTDLDLSICRFFYLPQSRTWLGKVSPFWYFFYACGEYVVFVPALLGIFLFLAGNDNCHLFGNSRRAGLFVILALLAAHLTVNTLLKSRFDRPRPRHVQDFNGTRLFRMVLTPGHESGGKSFPSGHAASGFSLMILYFALRNRRRVFAIAFVLAGMTMGTMNGIARISQGGHFASDVLWSFGVVYFVSYLLYRYWYLRTVP